MPLGRFGPSSGMFYWPFPGDASFVGLLYFFCLVFAVYLCASVCVCFVVACWGEGAWLLGSRLWCLAVGLSLSHWCPGSGVVLDCIDS